MEQVWAALPEEEQPTIEEKEHFRAWAAMSEEEQLRIADDWMAEHLKLDPEIERVQDEINRAWQQETARRSLLARDEVRLARWATMTELEIRAEGDPVDH